MLRVDEEPPRLTKISIGLSEENLSLVIQSKPKVAQHAKAFPSKYKESPVRIDTEEKYARAKEPSDPKLAGKRISLVNLLGEASLPRDDSFDGTSNPPSLMRIGPSYEHVASQRSHLAIKSSSELPAMPLTRNLQ